MPRPIPKIFIPLLTLLVLVLYPLPGTPLSSPRASSSNRPFGFPLPEGPYDPRVPTPDAVLGFPFGQRPITPEEAFMYARTLADHATRVQLEINGTSWEGRPLYRLWVTSPSNLDRLPDYKHAWHELAYPNSKATPLPDNLPVLVWFAYSIHGNEHSSTEAALTLAYVLAASRNPDITRNLDRVVLIIEPVQNPDGRARFVQHVRQFLGQKPDPFPLAVEHREPWPGGRFNHYLFDLNRDWLFQTQRETRVRLQAFTQTPPQVFVDFHEMGGNESYYFAPPSDPVLDAIPAFVKKSWILFGRENARAFDRHGWPYFIREVFDIFYPGYGDSFPSLQGTVGMTFEQASPRGIILEREDKTLLTLTEAIEHHFTTGLITWKTAAAHQYELLERFKTFRASSIFHRNLPFQAWVVPGDIDPFRYHILVARLKRLHAVFHILNHPTALHIRPLDTSDKSTDRLKTLPARTIVIPTQQATATFLNIWFMNDVPIDPRFIQIAKARRREGENPGFYDITAWSLPLAWNIPMYIAREMPESHEDTPQKSSSNDSAPTAGSYAYLVCPPGLALYQMAGEAIEQAFPFRVGRKKTVLDGTECPAGSLLFFTRQQPPAFGPWMRSWQKRNLIRIVPLDSGWVNSGISPGSNDFRPVHQPSITVLLMGEGISPTETGALWFTLEQEYHWPIRRVRPRDLARSLTPDVRGVILPSLRFTSQEWLNSDGIKSLKRWVENGGTLILIGSSATWAARHGLVKSKIQKAGESKEESPDREKLPPANIPGALLQSVVHATGLWHTNVTDTIPVLYRGRDYGIVKTPKDRVLLSFPEKEPVRLSGFTWPDLLEEMKGHTLAWIESDHAGTIVVLLFDPVFRGDFFGTHPLLMNALLYGHLVR